MLAGVAGGLAEMIGIDVTLIRIGWVVLALASGGIVVLLYILMAIIVPEEPEPTVGQPATGTAWSDAGGHPVQRADVAPGGSHETPPPYPGAAPPPAGETPRQRRNDRAAALVLGGVLVAAGVLLLVRRFIPALDSELLWPIVLVALGLVLLLGSFRRR